MADQVGTHPVEGGLHGGELSQDLFAILALLDHPLQPAHLALDPGQPVEDTGVVLGHGPLGVGVHRRRLGCRRVSCHTVLLVHQKACPLWR